MEGKIHFKENWLIFWGIWGEAALILRIWRAKEYTFRELRNFLSGIWGDQCIIFRNQGTQPPGGLTVALLSVVDSISSCKFDLFLSAHGHNICSVKCL